MQWIRLFANQNVRPNQMPSLVCNGQVGPKPVAQTLSETKPGSGHGRLDADNGLGSPAVTSTEGRAELISRNGWIAFRELRFISVVEILGVVFRDARDLICDVLLQLECST